MQVLLKDCMKNAILVKRWCEKCNFCQKFQGNKRFSSQDRLNNAILAEWLKKKCNLLQRITEKIQNWERFHALPLPNCCNVSEIFLLISDTFFSLPRITSDVMLSISILIQKCPEMHREILIASLIYNHLLSDLMYEWS